MRVSTAFNRLLRLDGVTVSHVTFEDDTVTVGVRLRRRRLVCPVPGCGYKTSARADTRPADSWWRHLDMGTWKVKLTSRLRRLDCPDHGVTSPSWSTTPPATWCGAGKARTPPRWTASSPNCALTGPNASPRSAWTPGLAYPKSVSKNAPQATICWDPFHVVQLATKALDVVRREHWNHLRTSAGPADAKTFKGARWSLLKNPDDLTDTQADQLAAIRRSGTATWRAYQGKEQLRGIFAGDVEGAEVERLLARWRGWAQRSRLEPFVELGRTIAEHTDGIIAAIRLGLSNGRVESRNAGIRLLVRRAWGLHSAQAVAALVMLNYGPITLTLPHEKLPQQ